MSENHKTEMPKGVDECLEDIKAFPNRVHLAGIVGSHAYGTASPDSDLDVMAVFTGDSSDYIGLSRGQGSIQKETEFFDNNYLEIRKFFTLALKANPNVLPLFYLRYPQDYLKVNSFGQMILEAREHLATKRVYTTFCGYARGQINRMDTSTEKLGAKRKELRKKFGYDTKFAYHTIRLLKTAHKFLLTGEMEIYRHDASELLSIRNGALKKREFLRYANSLFADLEEAVKKSPLPDEPNYKAVDEICQAIVAINIWKL